MSSGSKATYICWQTFRKWRTLRSPSLMDLGTCSIEKFSIPPTVLSSQASPGILIGSGSPTEDKYRSWWFCALAKRSRRLKRLPRRQRWCKRRKSCSYRWRGCRYLGVDTDSAGWHEDGAYSRRTDRGLRTAPKHCLRSLPNIRIVAYCPDILRGGVFCDQTAQNWHSRLIVSNLSWSFMSCHRVGYNSLVEILQKEYKIYQQHFFLCFFGGFMGDKFLLPKFSDFNVMVGG